MNISLLWLYHWSGFNQIKRSLLNFTSFHNHNVEELSCRGSLEFCYSQEASDRIKILTCLLCNVRRKAVTSRGKTDIDIHSLLSKNSHTPFPNNLFDSARSSLHTLIGSEHPDDLINAPPLTPASYSSIHTSLAQTYAAFYDYLSTNLPDIALILNGRMDHLRLYTELCHQFSVPYICLERSLLNHGVNVFPNTHCLDLSYASHVLAARLKVALPSARFEYCKNLLVARCNGSLPGELIPFRKGFVQHNKHAKAIVKNFKICFLLSSEAEIYYDNITKWQTLEHALRSFVDIFDSDSICVRGHPLWSVKKANVTTSSRSSFNSAKLANDDYYQSICADLGVKYFPSYSEISSLELASQSNLVVLQNSSIYYELTLLHKSIVCLKVMPYSHNPNVVSVLSPEELHSRKSLLLDLANGIISLISPEESLDVAVSSFHAIAFDYPLLHSNICSATTSVVRQEALKSYDGLDTRLASFFSDLIVFRPVSQ